MTPGFRQRYATLSLHCSMKSHALGLMLLLIGLLTACSKPKPLNWPAITKAEVTYFNLQTGRGDEPFKSIEMTGESTPLIRFVDGQFRTRMVDSCNFLDRESFSVLRVNFYQGDSYQGTLGIGSIRKQATFIKYSGYGYSNAWCISEKEQQEFLALLDFTEADCQKIFRR
jgi:hypothetical protein